jgi:hypothetical protein
LQPPQRWWSPFFLQAQHSLVVFAVIGGVVVVLIVRFFLVPFFVLSVVVEFLKNENVKKMKKGWGVRRVGECAIFGFDGPKKGGRSKEEDK